jgi:uncharacterized protein YciI
VPTFEQLFDRHESWHLFINAHSIPCLHQSPSKQYRKLKRGSKGAADKPAAEQALGNHGRYLQEQMTKGALQLAGPFLDDSGGLILYNARDEAEVRAVAEHLNYARRGNRCWLVEGPTPFGTPENSALKQ